MLLIIFNRDDSFQQAALLPLIIISKLDTLIFEFISVAGRRPSSAALCAVQVSHTIPAIKLLPNAISPTDFVPEASHPSQPCIPFHLMRRLVH